VALYVPTEVNTPLYVPTEVNTPQVDGLARISGLSKVLALKNIPEGFGFWFVILHTASNSITSERHTSHGSKPVHQTKVERFLRGKSVVLNSKCQIREFQAKCFE